jgi:hypothetical protein
MAMALQFLGVLFVLVPFVLVQLRRMTASAPVYLWMNFIGGITLAWLAAASAQWGFVLLEGAWGLAAAASLARRVGSSSRPEVEALQ